MKILLSFDIDGTLETGDPPGPVTLEMVKRARDMGCIIGSASDRAISAQKVMWEKVGIEVDFVSNKHVLSEIKERFEADYYLHMGDRELDRQFALEAGFDFIWMDEAATEPWILKLQTETAATMDELSGNNGNMKILLSFDIDGTLETGDPPGPVTLEMVKRARDMGCIIGSASDRAITSQNLMWEKGEIEPEFVCNKHLLTDIKQKFKADYYLHMGDRELDRQYALEAEFDFMWQDEAATEPWIAMLKGEVDLNSGSGSPDVASSGASRLVIQDLFKPEDCQVAEKDVKWCVTHHKPIWECESYASKVYYSPRKDEDGLS